jgi:hypothetical protein
VLARNTNSTEHRRPRKLLLCLPSNHRRHPSASSLRACGDARPPPLAERVVAALDAGHTSPSTAVEANAVVQRRDARATSRERGVHPISGPAACVPGHRRGSDVRRGRRAHGPTRRGRRRGALPRTAGRQGPVPWILSLSLSPTNAPAPPSMSIARVVVVEKVYLGEQGSGATRRPAPRWCHTPRHQRRQWTARDGGRIGVGVYVFHSIATSHAIAPFTGYTHNMLDDLPLLTHVLN